MVLRALVACLLLTGGACHMRTFAPSDAGLDSSSGETALADAPEPLALDFAVTGCAHYDVGQARCTGLAPLTVSFSPVGSAALTRFLWTFGDGTPTSSERAPAHTYVLPGVYDVSVVAEGKVGSLSRKRMNFVEVTAAGIGAPCDVDSQCDPGLRCRCGIGAGCGPAFTRGLCTGTCPTNGCGAGAVCATVDLPAQPVGGVGSATDAGSDVASEAGSDAASDVASAGLDAGADAGSDTAPPVGDAGTATGPAALCLAPCTDDASCPLGLACRTLPAAGKAAVPWVQACLPPFFREMGDSCRDATGRLDNALCASGLCADLGALGLCSAACGAAAECPTGSACATMGNGQALCLRGCAASAPCARDPLLGCEAPGGPGALGFQMPASTPGATFCAPRRCTTDGECGPAGTCTPLGVGAHCLRRAQ
jgi:PKD domain